MVRRGKEDPSPLVRASLILAAAATATTEESFQRDLLPSLDTLPRLPQVKEAAQSAHFLSELLVGRWALRVHS